MDLISDIDECKDQNPCVNGICGNTNGSFDCICQEGYKRVNETFCSKEKSGAPNTALLVYVPLSMYSYLINFFFLTQRKKKSILLSKRKRSKQ